jgi:hypothetical protein
MEKSNIESRPRNSLVYKVIVIESSCTQRAGKAMQFYRKAGHESSSYDFSLVCSSIGALSVKLGSLTESKLKKIVSQEPSDTLPNTKFLSTIRGNRFDRVVLRKGVTPIATFMQTTSKEKIYLSLHELREIAQNLLSTDTIKNIVIHSGDNPNQYAESVINQLIESVVVRVDDKSPPVKTQYIYCGKNKKDKVAGDEVISIQYLKKILDMNHDQLKEHLDKKSPSSTYEKRLIKLLLKVYRLLNNSSEYVKAWILETPNHDLGGTIPFELLLRGKIEEIESLVYAIELGQTS